MSSVPTHREPALDGLRGIAILLVMYHHLMRMQGWDFTVNDRLLQFTESFHIGVDLFLVLSGYLITQILLRQRTSGNYYKSFYWRRFLRIFPLYFATVFCLILLLPGEFNDATPWYLLFASNIYMVFAGFAHQIITPLWSVALEEQFYAVWPYLLRHTRSNLLPICLCAVLLSQPLLRSLLPSIYVNPLTRLDGLVIGALIAVSGSQVIEYLGRFKLLFPLLLLSLGYLLMRAVDLGLSYSSGIYFFELFDFFLVSLAFGSILLCTLSKEIPLFNRVLGTRVLRSFGTYSYSLYLFHSILGYYVLKAGLVLPVGVGLQQAVYPILWSSSVVGLMWVISRYIWEYFEAPLLKQKDRVAYQPAV